jgi:hypothetical protein
MLGCGQERPTVPAPPHGGTAFVLPQGIGFVEVLRQDDREQPGRTKLLVYFIDPELKPFPFAPTAVTFQSKGRNAAKIALTPAPDGDPAKAGGLASEHFEDPGDIVGTLAATIDSKPVAVSISVR